MHQWELISQWRSIFTESPIFLSIFTAFSKNGLSVGSMMCGAFPVVVCRVHYPVVAVCLEHSAMSCRRLLWYTYTTRPIL